MGCTLALALRGSGLRVALHDAGAAAPAFRPLALSYATRLIFERLGVWASIPATPIERILVSQAGRFGRTRLDAADAGVPALGYVAEYAAVVAALRSAAGEFLTGDTASARCIVHAEGTPQDGAEKRYPHDAVVALVHAEPPAGATAFERFTADGPLALLPHGGRYAVVWSMRTGQAERVVAESEKDFLARFSAIAGPAPGRPVAVQWRSVQPLTLKVRPTRVQGNEVYIGNAAQTLHPVAGQGLNLGLRDAWELATALSAADPGEPATLAHFAAQRRLDASATIRVTDFLAAGFSGSGAFSSIARGAALTALDIFPAPRRFFARRMIFGASALP
ncbi:MAG TPA: FAD-dependent monooxygenase [Burkholderiales bacterium]|nr:FAD-dependent monooxygenase [Burkholderiales bacterium]